MLLRGFTTVRDVGGATVHYKRATEQWLIPGPRLFVGGPVMSQTGGHGDSITTQFGEVPVTGITPSHGNTLGGVADGVDACLKLARKIMMDGAVRLAPPS